MLVAMVCDNFWNSASDLAPVLTPPPGVYCDELMAAAETINKIKNYNKKFAQNSTKELKSSICDKDKRDK